MKALFILAFALLAFFGPRCAGPAQTSPAQTSPAQTSPAQTSPAQTSPVTGSINLNLLGRVAAVGTSGTKLYSTDLRLGIDPAPGVHLQFFGTHRYGLYGVQEASVQREWGGMAGQASAGIVRLPFGIYDPRETYASGLINYPLVRNDYGSHSVDWGVPGVAWTGGPPTLQIEAAAFGGKGTGIWDDQGHIRGVAARAQTYAGDAIFGLSRWDGALQADDGVGSSPTLPVHLTGLDLRYTRPQLLVRGEYLFGTLAGDRMTGWYLDAYYRLPHCEHWSLVGRLERLKPGSDYSEGRQLTLGVRCVAAPDWTLSANWRTNNGLPYGSDWTPSASKGGDIYFQAYHRVAW